MKYKVDKEKWHTCRLCGANIKELAKKYGGSGTYYNKVFTKHLQNDHQMTALEYFKQLDNIPKCPCGICNKELKLNKGGSSDFWFTQPCGRNNGIMKWSEQAKIDRCGKNNPMYGKKAWNNGLTKNDHPSLLLVSEKSKHKTFSNSTRQKMSSAAKNREIHGHTGHKHNKENIEKFRQNTLKMIRDGKFKQTQTRPHNCLKQILTNNNIKFQEEVIVSSWCFDFYLPQQNTYIEVDGDYFHCNPNKYPDGPKTKTQKINKYRDYKKDKFCQDNKINLVRIWESDILKGDEQCILKKLLI